MATEIIIQLLSDYLFADEEASVYAVLDGASIKGLLAQFDEHQPERVCLYRGELAPDMAHVAPYLVKLEDESPFADWVLGKGWGEHWGIFAVSGADLAAMRRHFRSFLTVHDPTGKPLLFRYYDPRVLRVFLPTCNADELGKLFGPVTAYVMEDEQPGTALRFQQLDGVLRREPLTLLPQAAR
jgi:hypothetical protein